MHQAAVLPEIDRECGFADNVEDLVSSSAPEPLPTEYPQNGSIGRALLGSVIVLVPTEVATGCDMNNTRVTPQPREHANERIIMSYATLRRTC
ncbi:hypothetical protein EVAR_18351_1 [Eumeta japonica]|uniref:Uncharacterized protein n=1 Tax=Eumeta variegata TaxID=151549 RepID=A0A4C1VC86_EUMVA|nr:hypothetical protein EVAR_18351_1 [Eumeta japonica]